MADILYYADVSIQGRVYFRDNGKESLHEQAEWAVKDNLSLPYEEGMAEFDHIEVEKIEAGLPVKEAP